MKPTFYACAAALALSFAAGATDLTEPLAVSNTRVSQDRATQMVTVTYELANQGEPAYVTMDVLTNGVPIGMQYVKTVKGDISQRGLDVLAGGAVADNGLEKTIVWDAHRDWRGNLGTNVTVQVTAWYTNSLPRFYMVVDLSGGTAAERFPVTMAFAPPDPTDVTCVSNKLWLRYVPPGTFTMGSPEDEPGHNYANNASREYLHQVTLTRGFYAGVFEATRAQYRLVLGNDRDPSDGISWLRPVNRLNMNRLWGEGFDPSRSNETAATSFFGVLRAKTGLTFTLPTDAQWEYACRAGTATPYNVATNDMVKLSDIAWYSGNASSAGIQVVGKKLSNAWGFYDMHGNVYEYCRDLLTGRLTNATDPLLGTFNSSTGGYVMRGGSTSTPAENSRSAHRGWRAATNTSNSDIGQNGFRVWLTLDNWRER